MTVSPLPEWVTEVRPHQQVAVEQAVAAFNDGADVVFIDAPTGSGKTLIGELVRRAMNVDRTLYVCSDKTLQDQFIRDFPYARSLKGRSNYPTEYGGTDVTCEDCTAAGPTDACMWCDGHGTCPYQVAKRTAATAELAVVNTSYLLTEANYVGRFSGFDLVIIDEADTLESILMGFVDYTVPRYAWRELRLRAPVKGARKPTLMQWLDGTASRARQHLARNSVNMEPKMRRRWQAFIADTTRVQQEIQRDIDRDEDADDTGRWLRDYDTDTFTMKPVLVGQYGPRNLWRHGRKFLLMSATIVSADEMADSLGLPLDWQVVTVPMTFPVENRPVVLAPVANVTYQQQDAAVVDLTYAISKICERHPDDRVMVHTVSYGLNKKLTAAVQAAVGDRKIVTYTESRQRDAALNEYLNTPRAVLLSPSMERGVDLKGDACRVVVVAKVPFPALGDRRIAARTRLPGGQQWYTVQTIRDIVQMTGRGVRSADDWAITYVLDSQFTKNVWRNKFLFPEWWREAVDLGADVRWLMPSRVKSVVSSGTASTR